jgi:hypothetical protein
LGERLSGRLGEASGVMMGKRKKWFGELLREKNLCQEVLMVRGCVGDLFDIGWEAE